MNKCIFLGRLARDPEIRYTQGDNPLAVANYVFAVDRKYKREGEPTADYINCVAYGKAAEFVEKYVKKGTKLLITARVNTRNYINKERQKVYVTEFIVDDHEFTESKVKVSNEQNNEIDSDGFMHIPSGLDEELPFN